MDAMRFERHMSDSDALMWAIEKDPVLRSTITAVALLDRPPDRDRLVERVEHVTRVVPRLRQRVQRAPLVPAPPRWVTEAGVDLAYHLRFVRAPGEGSPRDLLDLAAPLCMQGFDRARPLWEFVLVEGLADGRAALIQKVHHSITDGVGGMRLAMALLDLERDGHDASALDIAAPGADEPSPARLVFEALGHEYRRQAGIARRATASGLRAVRSPLGTTRRTATVLASAARVLAPVFEPMSPVMRRRSLGVRFDTLSAPLDDLKAAAGRADGRLNDAFVTAVAGGLRRYHEHHGRDVDYLRMTMPISIRSEETAGVAGNQFVPARFPVPIGVTDPVQRLRLVKDLVRAQRAEPALAYTEIIAGVLNRLPTTVVTRVFGSLLKGIDFVTSNVPGAPVPVYLAGARVDAQLAFAPLTGAAANITLISHVGEVHIGIATDPAAVPDPDVFAACLEAGFDEVRKLA